MIKEKKPKKVIIAEYKFKIFHYEGDNTRYLDVGIPKQTTTMDMDNIYSWARDMYDKITKEGFVLSNNLIQDDN